MLKSDYLQILDHSIAGSCLYPNTITSNLLRSFCYPDWHHCFIRIFTTSLYPPISFN